MHFMIFFPMFFLEILSLAKIDAEESLLHLEVASHWSDQKVFLTQISKLYYKVTA